MKKLTLITIIFLFAALTSSVFAGDKEDILAALNNTIEAFNKHDIQAYFSNFVFDNTEFPYVVSP